MQIITIDGPASSGKGTIAKIIAKKLKFHYLESGAIYRVVGLIANRNKIADGPIDELLTLIDKMQLQFINDVVSLNGEDVTNLIRDEQIGMVASKLSSIPKLRSRLLAFQRSFAKIPGLVTDGRDMGSIVFPDATLKVFLTASSEVRANRRLEQLQKVDRSVTITPILRDIQERDLRDSKRSVAPLTYDESFKVLDNSDMTVDETVNRVITWLDEVSN